MHGTVASMYQHKTRHIEEGKFHYKKLSNLIEECKELKELRLKPPSQ
ncbi:hypothetical protein NC651_031190 [Populus alba x Populus x berolinensis]|nr:hypothetical protein NC651_031190 [Populus alba x Populus x berolinensis]